MFKWPGEAPSACAPEHELADFAELTSWQNNSTSTTSLSESLGRLEENDYSAGVPEEEETDRFVETAYAEIEQREETCRDGYPFTMTHQGYTLSVNRNTDNHKHIVYKYLLLATRLNMKDNRVHANIDGALLFEYLAAEVARNYLGERAESLVFGTAAGSSGFSSKINDLCKKMKEGGKFRTHSNATQNTKDGKLDIVVWKPFTDDREGKLIVFGQCKTGTSYNDQLTHLQPISFCTKWFDSFPAVLPVRAFFVSEALSRNSWYNDASDAGLLFDRCRIIDFCDDISPNVLKKVRKWTVAAAKATELPNP